MNVVTCVLQLQRYEGASTIYGPHTLSAYLQKYRGLARAIAQVRQDSLILSSTADGGDQVL